MCIRVRAIVYHNRRRMCRIERVALLLTAVDSTTSPTNLKGKEKGKREREGGRKEPRRRSHEKISD